ncbi:helix-turn-helix transcriptional regulator [Lachnospiraceae bacterium 62-35]
MSIYDEIGETIKYLRKQKGVTQEWLALECGISTSYLRRIEHGTANPTINELWRIAEVLEVDLRNPFAVSTTVSVVP